MKWHFQNFPEILRFFRFFSVTVYFDPLHTYLVSFQKAVASTDNVKSNFKRRDFYWSYPKTFLLNIRIYPPNCVIHEGHVRQTSLEAFKRSRFGGIGTLSKIQLQLLPRRHSKFEDQVCRLSRFRLMPGMLCLWSTNCQAQE